MNIKYTEYIESIYENYKFNHPYISGNLSLFRSIFKYSNYFPVTLYIDKKIKNDIAKYPSTNTAKYALYMIRDENIYLPSNEFNINEYIAGSNDDNTISPDKLY